MLNRKKLTFLIAFLTTLLILSVSVAGECSSDCYSCFCSCCSGFSTELDTIYSHYDVGEEVTVTFSSPGSCDVEFEYLYITRSTGCGYCFGCGCESSETILSKKFEEGYEPGDDWSWTWGQIDNSGKMVGPGRYKAIVETENCGQLDASFKIEESDDCCSSSCCGSGFFSLFCCDCN